jgi:hypothetical protein
MIGQGTWALAGTTGGLNGSVADEKGAPIAGATVTVSAPSTTQTVTTDAKGHFQFLTLPPDTYTISVEKPNYQPISTAGISVFADANQTLSLTLQPALKEIAHTVARAAGALVKAGTTADIYSVNASTASAVKALGGGGSLNSAYSAIAAVPGVFVPQGQAGWAQSVYVRGANYTQLGYEYDGVPVQRSFDQYAAGTLSALGQQELQVYTGAAPANVQSPAIGGFINQVIKTGTSPGYGTGTLGVGTPTFYHHLKVEAGGASPDRLFSYYAGFGGYNQLFRYFDQTNGTYLNSNYGTPFNVLATGCGTPNASAGCYVNTVGYNGSGAPVGPNGYINGPVFFGAFQNQIADREIVANIHLGIQHKKDAGRDDVQLLYSNSFLQTQFITGQNDWQNFQSNVVNGTGNYNGAFYDGATCACLLFGPSPQSYFDTAVYNGRMGVALTPGDVGNTSIYYQPKTPLNRGAQTAAVPTNRDFYQNEAGIVKAQYTHNIGSSAFARIYAYTFYSSWLQASSSGEALTTNMAGSSTSPDYNLITHTNGLFLQFEDQLNANHLLGFSAGYTRANTIRDNNQYYASSSTVAVAVDSTNPTNGICYGIASAGLDGLTPAVGVPTRCDGGTVWRYRLHSPGLGDTASAPLTVGACGAACRAPDVSAIGASTCGAGPCQYYTVGAGYRGPYNTVIPEFINVALEDTWHINDKLLFNIGAHYDHYKYILSGTTPGPALTNQGGPGSDGARTLYANNFLNWYCFSPTTGLAPQTTPNSCAAAGLEPTSWTNNVPSDESYTFFEWRLGTTYTLDPRNVIRLSYGKYAQPASTAFQEYNNVANNLPLSTNNLFYPLGYRSPAHFVRPEQSFNLDGSWEHQVKGSDVSWKITPYLRKTKDEIFNVLLDPLTNFVSGVNVANKTVSGVELALQKGDFNRDGFAALFNYTYTYGSTKFTLLQNGHTVVDGVNTAISGYNAFTKDCAPGGKSVNLVQHNTFVCGAAGPSAKAAPCFTTGGAADPACAAGDVGNPYFNAPSQTLFDPGGQYYPYNQLPGTGLSAVASSYIVPHIFTLVLNYKHKALALTPQAQLSVGGRYGSPTLGLGVDPSTCTGALAAAATDPRYQYGFAGGLPYDAQTCAGSITTPDPFSKQFDNFGVFIEPSYLTLNMQVSYDVNPHIKLTATAANLYNTCFGGTQVPWAAGNKLGCWYTSSATYAGNFYNPGNLLQPQVVNPYIFATGNTFQQIYGGQVNPVNLYFEAEFKL